MAKISHPFIVSQYTETAQEHKKSDQGSNDEESSLSRSSQWEEEEDKIKKNRTRFWFWICHDETNPNKKKSYLSKKYSHDENHSTSSSFSSATASNLKTDTDEVYIGFQHFLLFGKVIGLLSIEGLFQKDYRKLHIRKWSISSLINILICILLSLNVLIGLIGIKKLTGLSKDANQPHFLVARDLAMSIFFAIGLFSYSYLHRHGSQLIKIFNSWNDMSLNFTKKDLHLKRHVNWVAGLTMLSGISENILVHVIQFRKFSQDEAAQNPLKNGNASLLEAYYVRGHFHWANVVPYHPLVAILGFVSNKLALYGWNYIDLLIIIFSRAIYFKFKILYEQAASELIHQSSIGHKSINQDSMEKWKTFTSDHEKVCYMLQKIEKFLSPIILVSYGAHIYFICIQLHLGLTTSFENRDVKAAIYNTWSFLHLLARCAMVSLAGSRINFWAHRATHLFTKCPSHFYTLTVERADRFLSVNQIGFTGLGYFIVTKPLLLKVISVIFTFEMVMLQESFPVNRSGCL